MTKISVKVNGSSLTASADGKLTSGMVGIVVSVEYDSSWDGLIKTASFRAGGFVRSRQNIQNSTTVPWEVMRHHGKPLEVGVEGRDEDGNIVIPTVWAVVGTIYEGAVRGINGSPNPDDGDGDDASSDAVLYVKQNLTEEQKAQARENIGALGEEYRVIPELAYGVLSDSTGNLEYTNNSRLYSPEKINIRNGDVILHNTTENNYEYSLRFYDNDGNYIRTETKWTTGTAVISRSGKMRMCFRKADNSNFTDEEKTNVLASFKIAVGRADDVGVFSVNGKFPTADGNVDLNDNTMHYTITTGKYWASNGNLWASTTRASTNKFEVTRGVRVTLADTAKGTYRFSVMVYEVSGALSTESGWIADDYVVMQNGIIGVNIMRVDNGNITQTDVDVLNNALKVNGAELEDARQDLMQSITLEFNRTDGTSYQLVRIPMTTNGGRSVRPVVRLTSADGSLTGSKCSTLTYARRENTAFAMNAGLFNITTLQPAGQTIIDGVSVVDTPMTSDNGIAISSTECYPLCIDAKGWLSAPYPKTVDTATMIADGVVQATTGWVTIVKDYTVAEAEIATEIVHPGRYVQNVIGQFDNGDYIVCSVSNKGYGNSAPNDSGFTYTQVAQILVDKGVKFAYALDGGGSAQTVLGKRHINPIYEGTVGRSIPSVLVFEAS